MPLYVIEAMAALRVLAKMRRHARQRRLPPYRRRFCRARLRQPCRPRCHDEIMFIQMVPRLIKARRRDTRVMSELPRRRRYARVAYFKMPAMVLRRFSFELCL